MDDDALRARHARQPAGAVRGRDAGDGGRPGRSSWPAARCRPRSRRRSPACRSSTRWSTRTARRCSGARRARRGLRRRRASARGRSGCVPATTRWPPGCGPPATCTTARPLLMAGRSTTWTSSRAATRARPRSRAVVRRAGRPQRRRLRRAAGAPSPAVAGLGDAGPRAWVARADGRPVAALQPRAPRRATPTSGSWPRRPRPAGAAWRASCCGARCAPRARGGGDDDDARGDSPMGERVYAAPGLPRARTARHAGRRAPAS